MRKFLPVLLMVMLCLTQMAWAQDQMVTGRVTSGLNNAPLPGVNISVQGTTRSTTTNAEGMYQLAVPGNATLIFSAVGFDRQEVAVGDRTRIDIAMGENAESLQEVVVTALGVTREKKSLGYATQEIKGSDVSTAKEANFLNSLSGKVSGVEIRRNNNLGASTNVVIRGFKSLTGNNQALFVVDGVPIDNSNTNTASTTSGRGGYDFGNAAADINPDDIENINVLKGAAATALYGSRAANGVVMITTKKGTVNKGMGVTINLGYTLGMVDNSTFPQYQKQYGGGYGKSNDTDDGYLLLRRIGSDTTLKEAAPTADDASYGAPFDPTRMVYQWDAFDPTSPNYGKAQPWVAAANGPRYFFNNAHTFNGSVALDGGNERGQFRTSYTRFDQTGIMPNSRLQKNTFAFNGGFHFTDRWSATASVNFVRQDGLGRYTNGYSDNIMTSFRQWMQTNVDYKAQRQAYDRTGRNVTWNWADPDDLKPIYWDNPYFQRYQNYENDWRNRIFGNVTLNYKLNSWMDVVGRASLDTYTEQQNERVADGSIANNGTSLYSRYDRNFSENNYDLFLNFHHDLGRNISLTGLLGGNLRRTIVNAIFTSTQGGLVVPGLYAISNSASRPAVSELYSEFYQDGIFGNVSLGYKDFLYVEAALRRDRSSSLPTAHNTYLYPSLSGSLVFSNLLPGTQNWLSFGKLRANYAEVGNAAPPLSVNDTYTNVNPFGAIPLYSVNGVKRNQNLRSERTKSAEIGLEMQFLQRRAGLDLALYRTNTVDQIMPVSVSRATGYNQQFVNSGEIENRGVELSAFVLPVRTEKLSWRLGVNWTLNRNTVRSLYISAAGDTIKNLQIASFQQGVTLNAAVGEPYGLLRGTNYTYNNGQPIVGSNGYYAITNANAVIGNINPKWKLGITNALNFGNLTLSFLVDIQKGGSVFSLDQAYGRATGLYPETAFTNDQGKPVRNPIADGGGYIVPGVLADGTPNTKRVSATNYGLFGYVRNPNATFVYDASYVKLREVALSYNLPTSMMGGSGFFKGATLSLVGRNLWIIHKNLPYADPEDGLSSGNIQGFQSGVYPSLREVGANVKFSF